MIMPENSNAMPSSEIENFAGYLEFERLELIEKLDVVNGYTTDDLEKIALYGAAINSIRDAAKFKREQIER
jgi:hypothetical protein